LKSRVLDVWRIQFSETEGKKCIGLVPVTALVVKFLSGEGLSYEITNE